MIDFNNWFRQIVTTCDLIASKDAFTRTWILGDHSITSIHYYDELFEQLIGDLHLEECLQQFESTLREVGAFEALSSFYAALRLLDERIETRSDLQDPKLLLSSVEWATFQTAAKQVLALPAAQPYLSAAR